MGKPCPKYTAEFKRRAAQPYNERGTTYAEVAREAGVDPSSLADWARRASAAAPDAEANPFQMAEDLRRPRSENERLKRENEILLKRAPSSPAGSCRRRGEGGEVRFHPAQRGALERVGDVLGARRHQAGLLRVALARAERARPARRRARRRDLRGLRGVFSQVVLSRMCIGN
ncbi:transposase [Enorma massiliensis]|uniref:transposase n=1 Tax=Enorma massiliensis TaxID=1472761 RepID=UPI003A957B1B